MSCISFFLHEELEWSFHFSPSFLSMSSSGGFKMFLEHTTTSVQLQQPNYRNEGIHIGLVFTCPEYTLYVSTHQDFLAAKFIGNFDLATTSTRLSIVLPFKICATLIRLLNGSTDIEGAYNKTIK